MTEQARDSSDEGEAGYAFEAAILRIHLRIVASREDFALGATPMVCASFRTLTQTIKAHCLISKQHYASYTDHRRRLSYDRMVLQSYANKSFI